MAEKKKTRSNENGISPIAGEDNTFYVVDQNAEFKDDDIRRLRVTDPAHADTVFNPLFVRILNNIRALFRDKFNRSEFTKENILGKLTGGSGGGSGTGLDADTVDGKHASAFASTAVATSSANGLFSAADKRKLDGVQAGATNYVHPASHPVTMITGLGNAAKMNTGTAAGTVATGNHSHGAATRSAAGFMSAIDKKNHDERVGRNVSSGKGKCCEIIGVYPETPSDGENSGSEKVSTIAPDSHLVIAIGGNHKILDKAIDIMAIGVQNTFKIMGNDNVLMDACCLGIGNTIGSWSYALGEQNQGKGYFFGKANKNLTAPGINSNQDAVFIGSYNEYKSNNDNGIAIGDHILVGGYQTVVGQYNSYATDSSSAGTAGNKLIIGNGVTDDRRSNCFRVQSDGKVYAKGAYAATGADFAEYKEWLDGNPDNEDRRGYFVTFDGAMIRKATSKDNFILGVISANPVLIGNDPGENWQGRFEKDIFGSYIFAEYDAPETPQEKERAKAKSTEESLETAKSTWYVENPKYRSNESYIERDNRPEWGIVGCLGELVVVDDGTCEPNGYCLPNDEGIGTKSDDPRGYRVMKRLDETHILVWLHGRIIL